MGLISSLLNIGISVESAVSQVGVRFGKIPLQWPSGEDLGIVYRLSKNPHERASIFAETQPIVVNEGEVAVVLEDGKSKGTLEPGRYVFEKARVVGALDILWIKTGQRMLKWGIGNVSSSDGIQIGGNGVVYTKIADGAAFNAEVVQGNATLPDSSLQRFLMPRLQGVLRSTIAKWPALQIQAERESFTDGIRQALSSTFAQLGVAIVDFEVVEINFPPEFKEALSQSTLSQHLAKAEIIRAHTRSEVTQIEAVGSAQAQIMEGMAQVQIMAAMQAQGFDPLKLKALEALNTFAATPTIGGLMGGDPAKTALFGQLAAAAMTGAAAHQMSTPAPSTSVANPAQLPAGMPPPAEVTQVAPSSAPAAMPPETADDINRQIDALAERLSEGKVSEETYTKLVARLEAKLARLGG